MIPVEKPGTPAELVHHGTKGMKWGVRRSPVAQKFNRRHPDSANRADAIRTARGRTLNRAIKVSNINKGATKKQKKDLKAAYLRNPDRATALLLTRGEKITIGILAATVIGAPTAAAAVGTRVAIRRHIEKKQARGGYN